MSVENKFTLIKVVVFSGNQMHSTRQYDIYLGNCPSLTYHVSWLIKLNTQIRNFLRFYFTVRDSPTFVAHSCRQE